jgi:transposase
MKTTIEAIRTVAHEIEPLGHTPADEHLLAALPGAGTVDAARLTAALGTVSDRWTTGDAWRCCSGVAPVRERRGQSTWSRWRSCCPTFLRQSCHA